MSLFLLLLRLEKEGLACAHTQVGPPPPIEEQEKAATQGLPFHNG